MLAFIVGFGLEVHAQPVFEGKTPRGFSPKDSTTTTRFATGKEVNVLVDLNKAATFTYPVIGNFQAVEQSVPYFSAGTTAGYMSQAVAVDANGILHRAWVQRRGVVDFSNTASTPVYGVVYAKSFDGGKTFTDTVSVSGSLRFDMITPNVAFTSSFSTVDLVVDSKGNPRVVYAMDQSGDGVFGAGTGQISRSRKGYNNIYFNYSNDGGSSWLPANTAVVVNDTATVAGRKTAFPRMAITSTDDIFVVYEHDQAGAAPDIRLAKMAADSLKLGSAQPVKIGQNGTTTSKGGVRLDPEATVGLGPDIAVGDDDVLHVTWFSGTTTVVHKTVPANRWSDITALGWEQGVAGATVGTFTATAANLGIQDGRDGQDQAINAIAAARVHLFPTVVVDKARTPDRIYVLWKHTDETVSGSGNDENIRYNFYSYDGQFGAPTGAWSGTPSEAFPTGTALYSINAGPMFQSATRYQVESVWAYVDRVAAVVDNRKGTSSDLHIVFSGGGSVKNPTAISNDNYRNNLYYSRFNGVEWELPQVVATARGQTAAGAPSGVLFKHQQLFEPDLAMRTGDNNVYMTFVGGSSRVVPVGINVSGATSGPMPGSGYRSNQHGSIAPLPYFKILGRTVTFEDKSVPVGGFQYVLSYTPKNPQTTGLPANNNMVVVTAADNVSGTGIGASTPGSSQAPGGFLTGQWRRIGTSLGVTSLEPGQTGAIFKGAVSQNQAQNNNGVFEGKVNDGGSFGYAEWGDDADKVGLLVKLNVLGSNSSTNVFAINASTSARGPSTTAPDSSSQSISLRGYGANTPSLFAFVNGITSQTAPLATAMSAPMGSYFQMGSDIDIVAANTAPSVSITEPNSGTIATGSFGNESFAIRYTLFDTDDNVSDTDSDTLKASLYYYPDKGLTSVQDIKTFGTLIVDQRDVSTATTRLGTDPSATDDFTEGTSSSNEQTYTWDDPGKLRQTAFGWAPITKTLDGNYFIYIVAEDGINPPVFAVSAGAMKVRHIPLIKSLAPVAADTVDTGEFTNLAKVNPYKIKFTLVDYDDDAQVRLFVSTSSSISASSVSITGTFPNKTISLSGATPIQLSDTLRTDQDKEFDFDVTAQGSKRDSVIAQGNYFIYAVVADNDTFALSPSTNALAVRHSPSYEFTSPLKGRILPINTSQQDRFTIEWQRGRSDQDLDGNARISLYYTGVDPKVKDYSGTDSTALLATTGADSGRAVLIAGGIREDAEGGNDQFVWNFRNPPSALPKTFRPKQSGGPGNSANPHIYQQGVVVDTAWVYAVLSDSLGNTRVQVGGAVVLLGSQESPASQAPKVTMKSPPAGGMTVINGDVVRLEWDAFLVDDGTGTDDAYLRLYAAPKGKYSTLTDLESNNVGKPGGGGDVFVVNSLDGTTFSGTSRILDYAGSTAGKIKRIRESDPKFFLWDTKTTSFKIQGTPTEFDIFVAASMNPRFGENIYVNTRVDSVASGLGSKSQRAVLSKSPGALRVEGADPIYSIELGPGALAVSSGDTLDLQLLANSQNSSIDLMAFHLNVPRNYFEVIDQDTVTAGLQPFADSTGAFKTPSTIAQNDTTKGTAQFIKLNFVESVITGEVIGNTKGDSSQVAAKMQLKVKRFTGGAPLDTLLVWSFESGRKTGFRRGTTELAAPAREGQVTLMPRARIIATAPLEGRTNYSDTLDAHLRLIGSTKDITDQSYISANDIKPVFTSGGTSGTLEDSVQVKSDAFGTFTLTEIPPGVYELTVKARGYVTGRTDTLALFNGKTVNADPTFGSDALGNKSPATSLGALRGGDATGDNQVDIADANRVFSLWNKTPADSTYVRDADINADAVINSIDLGFVTANFGNDGFGAPPVFKRNTKAGDNAAALVELVGVEEVDAWWPGRVFEVRARVSGMNDVAAYGLGLSYDPERVKPLSGTQAVEEGTIFAENARGSLFFQRVQPGKIEVTAGRIGREWSASGDAELAVFRFVALADDPGLIEVVSGELVNSAHRGIPMRVKKAQALPQMAALFQNYPNPFNPSTEIRFDIPTARDVKLRIYNQLGQTVSTLVDQRMKAGSYRIKWDGKTESGYGVSSGVYFYSLEAGDFSQIRKMTLVK